jgi:hypothetical protein
MFQKYASPRFTRHARPSKAIELKPLKKRCTVCTIQVKKQKAELSNSFLYPLYPRMQGGSSLESKRTGSSEQKDNTELTFITRRIQKKKNLLAVL